MNDAMSVDLDHQERDILLRALRRVRSSVALAVCDPTPDSLEQKDQDLRDIESLMARLNGSEKKNGRESLMPSLYRL
jgi:hypothetical protein